MYLSGSALAQVIPGSADIGRIKPEERLLPYPEDTQPAPTIPQESNAAPVGVEEIHFVLSGVHIEKMNAIRIEEVKPFYQSHIGEEISLKVAWEIAEEITKLYRRQGYFLSRAYVPAQSIKDGIITIRVVEGYIGQVELDKNIADQPMFKRAVKQLTDLKPVKDKDIERFLLLLNDLPGISFRSVLTTMETEQGGKYPDSAAKMVLISEKEQGKGSISFDNYGSRFLGPNEATLSYQTESLPFQETTFSFSTSLPTDELKYAAIKHSFPLSTDVTIDIDASKIAAEPGYTLRDFELESDATFIGAGLNYKFIRQRQENLSFFLNLDARDTHSTILGTDLTVDRIRALRAKVNYDTVDKWEGTDTFTLILSRGLDGMGSSKSGDTNLSRAAAKPDFTKLQLQVSHLQALTDHWSLLAATSAQFSSKALYSAEEFGYGGQAFGRAYDNSEITGDAGVAASLQLQNHKWIDLKPIAMSPYLFYDIGKVFNRDAGTQAGASTGLGVKLGLHKGLTGDIGLAYPLTRSIATPIYGTSAAGPRILVQINNEF